MPRATDLAYPGRYFEAPSYWEPLTSWLPEPCIFLAGGITSCADWQSYVRTILDPRWTVFNPRRERFNTLDPTETKRQIEWEFEFLKRANVILFWFASSPSPQPIALYEFGRHVALGKARIIVGCDDTYSRRADVVTQYRLARPHKDHYVHNSLESLCAEANGPEFLPPL